SAPNISLRWGPGPQTRPPWSPARRSGGERTPGAGVAHVRDLVDGNVVQAAVDLADFADVDEGLDHVVRLGVETEVAARALELHLLDSGHQLVLVLGVPVHGLEGAHDDLRGVEPLAGEAIRHLTEV